MSANSQKSIRLAYIAAAYLAFIFLMLRAAFLPQQTASDDVVATGLAVFVTMACVADSAVLGRPIVFGARFPFAITWPVALPVYLLLSRGWWGIQNNIPVCQCRLTNAVAFQAKCRDHFGRKHQGSRETGIEDGIDIDIWFRRTADRQCHDRVHVVIDNPSDHCGMIRERPPIR
jgi:hypothetical protein